MLSIVDRLLVRLVLIFIVAGYLLRDQKGKRGEASVCAISIIWSSSKFQQKKTLQTTLTSNDDTATTTAGLCVCVYSLTFAHMILSCSIWQLAQTHTGSGAASGTVEQWAEARVGKWRRVIGWLCGTAAAAAATTAVIYDRGLVVRETRLFQKEAAPQHSWKLKAESNHWRRKTNCTWGKEKVQSRFFTENESFSFSFCCIFYLPDSGLKVYNLFSSSNQAFVCLSMLAMTESVLWLRREVIACFSRAPLSIGTSFSCLAVLFRLLRCLFNKN